MVSMTMTVKLRRMASGSRANSCQHAHGIGLAVAPLAADNHGMWLEHIKEYPGAGRAVQCHVPAYVESTVPGIVGPAQQVLLLAHTYLQ
jgi:hypothetical protein